MNQVYAKLQNCYECVRKKTDFVPKVAIVLGSGLMRRSRDFLFPPYRGMPVNLSSVISMRFLWCV